MPWVVPPRTPPGVPTGGVSAAAPPQFDVPFRLGSDGQPVTVEQDSPEEIGAAIYNVLTCPQGAKLNDPDFGIPQPLFAGLPLDTRAIVKAVQSLEPRATTEAIQEAVTSVEAPVRLDVTAQVPVGN